MKSFSTLRSAILAVVLTAAAGCAAPQELAVVTDRPAPPPVDSTRQAGVAAPAVVEAAEQVEPGRFDKGKMWTFDNPPLDYFQEAYGFRPDSAWFAKARLGALRIPGCTASFVSPNGLILTNHHCGRSYVSQVSQPGDSLLDKGFYARRLAEERKVEDLYADQLIDIRDVTAEVYRGARDAEARQERAEQLETRLTQEAKQRDTTLTVEVIELYSGGRYSAYTFKRYHDIRLVMAPEMQLGMFGGDPDNFTYPRYSLDFSLFRVYGPDGTPFKPEVYFPWSTEGVEEGDAVFVVGNPGSTSRMGTVSQLLYERDFTKPHEVELFRSRSRIVSDYVRAHPALADSFDLRNTVRGLENERKRAEGELAGLRDPELIARRRAADERLQQVIQATDSLRQQYGTLIQTIADLQRAKEASARQAAGFTYFLSPLLDAHVLIRAVYARILSLYREHNVPKDQIDNLRKAALEIEDWPAELDEALLAARLRELQESLGTTDPTLNRILAGRTPEAVAADIIANTALGDSARYAALLDGGYMRSGDPTVPLATALTPIYFSLVNQLVGLEQQEDELNARLALATFAAFGTAFPPDATFSLRIADGVVRGYEYNGTVAPPFTTFYGLYGRYHAHRDGEMREEWDLPARWLNPPASFDLSTPLNLVSTNDITGGNSGSPLLDRDLRLVGLIFDSNIEGLPGTYLYTEGRGRAVSVDARGILESLDDMYDADRLVLELTTGTLAESEEEADAIRASN